MFGATIFLKNSLRLQRVNSVLILLLILMRKEEALLQKMQIPGIDPSVIEVLVEGNHLCIKGVRDEEKKEKVMRYYRKEIRCGKFVRLIPLPALVKLAGIRKAKKPKMGVAPLPIARVVRREKWSILRKQ